MLATIVIVYLVLLCCVLLFMAGVAIVDNKRWDESTTDPQEFVDTLAPEVAQPTKSTEVDLQTKIAQADLKNGFGTLREKHT